MRQLVARTVRRGLVRAELWNGNVESLRNLLSTDADRNVVLWSWRTHGRYHDELPDAARAAAPHARVVVLTSRREADRLLAELAELADGAAPAT